MAIVSGFNHNIPQDNNKPLIFNNGEDTYVMNKIGNGKFYSTDKNGNPVTLDVVRNRIIPVEPPMAYVTVDYAGGSPDAYDRFYFSVTQDFDFRKNNNVVCNDGFISFNCYRIDEGHPWIIKYFLLSMDNLAITTGEISDINLTTEEPVIKYPGGFVDVSINGGFDLSSVEL